MARLARLINRHAGKAQKKTDHAVTFRQRMTRISIEMPWEKITKTPNCAGLRTQNERRCEGSSRNHAAIGKARE
ncbi:hypothetical protein ASC90_26275 [Rhizobium sp. Root1220]|nr:hypothetical protein ASC90_26275 [Rhizobium sp. Root1220]